jgi:hypothetical protein
MPPLQPLVHEDLANAAALDRDALLLVEVGPQAVQCPAAEGELKALRVGQSRGDNLGTLLGGIGVRAAGAGPIPQALEALLIEAMDPGVDGGAGQPQVLGDLAGPPPIGDGQEDLGPLDGASLRGARSRKLFKGLAFLGSQVAELEFGGHHGCTSLRTRLHPFYVRPQAPVLLPDAPLSRMTEVL